MPWERNGKVISNGTLGMHLEDYKDEKVTMGFEDVYKACWKGPDFTYKLPSLEVLNQTYHLISPAGTFNKKVCGCPTADRC